MRNSPVFFFLTDDTGHIFSCTFNQCICVINIDNILNAVFFYKIDQVAAEVTVVDNVYGLVTVDQERYESITVDSLMTTQEDPSVIFGLSIRSYGWSPQMKQRYLLPSEYWVASETT